MKKINQLSLSQQVYLSNKDRLTDALVKPKFGKSKFELLLIALAICSGMYLIYQEYIYTEPMNEGYYSISQSDLDWLKEQVALENKS